LHLIVNFRTLLAVGRPARTDQPPTEPSTQSYAELVAWLHGPPRRSQGLLAVACRVSQATLSQYTSRRARPHADSEVALLLQIATGGRVTALGWLTDEERVERLRFRTRARKFARAIATGKRVMVTMRIASVASGAREGGPSLAAVIRRRSSEAGSPTRR
jgi:hypothetical protein